MSAAFFWAYICELERLRLNMSMDAYEAWLAGPRGMDNHTETALTS